MADLSWNGQPLKCRMVGPSTPVIYSPGRVVRVRFRADPSLSWDRLVLKHLAGSTYLVETEVGEVYPLVLSTPPLLRIDVVPSPLTAVRGPGLVTMVEERPLRSASELCDLVEGSGSKGTVEELQILGSQSAEAGWQSFGNEVWRPLLPGTMELGEAGPLPEGASFFGGLALVPTLRGPVIYSNQSLADLGFAEGPPPAAALSARTGGSAPKGGVSYRPGERSRAPAGG